MLPGRPERGARLCLQRVESRGGGSLAITVNGRRLVDLDLRSLLPKTKSQVAGEDWNRARLKKMREQP